MPQTVLDHAIATDQDGARVQVWDNELDDIVYGTVKYHREGWPSYTVTIEAGQYGDGSTSFKVHMMQGPYTDNGRFRIVGVLPPFNHFAPTLAHAGHAASEPTGWPRTAR